MTDTSALWSVVDSLTRPSRLRIDREDLAESAAAELLHDLATNPRRTVCHVANYRALTARVQGQAASRGDVPCLLDLAEAGAAALGDSNDSGGGSSPARERSITDLDILEILHQLREAVDAELARTRGTAGRDKLTHYRDRVRAVTSDVARSNDPDKVTFWTRRIAQWTRILEDHLQTVDSGPKPIRLRGTTCPRCGARQATIVQNGERMVVPALVIDFNTNTFPPMVRAASCLNPECGAAWMRGEAMEELAGIVNPARVDTRMVG